MGLGRAAPLHERALGSALLLPALDPGCRKPEAEECAQVATERQVLMLDVSLFGKARLAWIALSLSSLLLAVAGCGGTVKTQVQVPCPNDSDLVQASSVFQVQGTIRNAAVVGQTLAAVSSANEIAKTSLRSGFGPLNTCGTYNLPANGGSK